MANGFSSWTEEPNGDGIYHFKGWRDLPVKNGIVATNDLVEVVTVKEGFREYKCVLFLGRSHKYRLFDFRGKWRKLLVDFQGERRR